MTMIMKHFIQQINIWCAAFSLFLHWISGLILWPFKVSMATCINILVWAPCQIWKAFFWCKWQSDLAAQTISAVVSVSSGSTIWNVQILFWQKTTQYVTLLKFQLLYKMNAYATTTLINIIKHLQNFKPWHVESSLPESPCISFYDLFHKFFKKRPLYNS